MRLRSSALIRTLGLAALTVGIGWGASSPGLAQSPGPLPTAPGAEKAANGASGPATSAQASLPGDNGSPVEPWLFLFILAGGGIIGVGTATITDRYVRSSYSKRALVG